jgi:nitrite reductase/ring-hydroxylating ferredoxin subunit
MGSFGATHGRTTPMTLAPTAIDVCSSEDVPEGGRLVLDIGDMTIGLFRVKGRLYAYDNVCPHMGGPVCQGLLINGVREVLGEHQQTVRQEFNEDDPHIVCPWHGFEFSITSGRHAGTGRPELRKFTVSESGGRVNVSL